MIIKIDTRESNLLQQINQHIVNVPIFKSILVKSETLPIGDIIISDDKEDKLIIERKTLSDLISSIKDGRYEEQSYRLNGLNHHNHNIIYLVEGDLTRVNRVNRFKTDDNLEKITMYSAMFSLNYYKGFSVFRSFSLEESATIICNMAYKLEKGITSGKKEFYQNYATNNVSLDESQMEGGNNLDSLEKSEKDYVGVIKKVKKENITPDNIGEIMLCQIPGVSSVTALAIMEKYNSLPSLIKEIENNNDCLKDITSTNAKGQVRKISKSSIANIVKFLLKK
jgi:crossover junction endonuclease MUS81